jgi:uncharacterized protein involved in outer membrane biogenesis
VIAAVVGLLQFIPLSGYVPAVEVIMAKRLGQPVSISNMRYAVFPSPRLTLERVGIGKLQDVKMNEVYVPVGPAGLIGGTRSFDTIEAKGVSADYNALGMVAGWIRAQPDEPAVKVEIPPFDVDTVLGGRAELIKAVILLDKARFTVTPKDKVWEVKLSASAWKPFIGPALEFDELEATAVVDSRQATVTEVKGRVAGGSLSGQLNAHWHNSIRATGSFRLENSRMLLLMPAFTRNFSASGTLRLNANFALSGDSLRTLFEAARMEGGFAITSGELNNVDIVRALQSNRATGQRGGKTRFETLTGTVQISGNTYSYRQLQLSSGPMSASGVIDVRGGAVSGQVNAELGSKAGMVARAALTAEGKVSDPVLR